MGGDGRQAVTTAEQLGGQPLPHSPGRTDQRYVHAFLLVQAALRSYLPVSYTHLTLPTNREV